MSYKHQEERWLGRKELRDEEEGKQKEQEPGFGRHPRTLTSLAWHLGLVKHMGSHNTGLLEPSENRYLQPDGRAGVLTPKTPVRSCLTKPGGSNLPIWHLHGGPLASRSGLHPFLEPTNLYTSIS